MQSSGVNKATKLYIGAPANSSEGSHYVDSPVLQKYIDATWANYSSAFGGVMLWDAYGAKGRCPVYVSQLETSHVRRVENNNYDQQVKKILSAATSKAGATAADMPDAAPDTPTTPTFSALPVDTDSAEATSLNTAESDSTAGSPDTSVPSGMSDVLRRHRSPQGHPHEGLARF